MRLLLKAIRLEGFGLWRFNAGLSYGMFYSLKNCTMKLTYIIVHNDKVVQRNCTLYKNCALNKIVHFTFGQRTPIEDALRFPAALERSA